MTTKRLMTALALVLGLIAMTAGGAMAQVWTPYYDSNTNTDFATNRSSVAAGQILIPGTGLADVFGGKYTVASNNLMVTYTSSPVDPLIQLTGTATLAARSKIYFTLPSATSGVGAVPRFYAGNTSWYKGGVYYSGGFWQWQIAARNSNGNYYTIGSQQGTIGSTLSTTDTYSIDANAVANGTTVVIQMTVTDETTSTVIVPTKTATDTTPQNATAACPAGLEIGYGAGAQPLVSRVILYQQSAGAYTLTPPAAGPTTAPASGPVGQSAMPFVIQPNATLAAATTYTLASSVAGDTFSATPGGTAITSVSQAAGSNAAAPFYLISSSTTGPRTVSTTNSQGLTDPAGVTYTATRAAATFYVSATGSDSANGTSAGTAWQTVTKANSGPAGGYIPGDTVAFQGGGTFAGAVAIGGSGAPYAPITITSYGTGRATINSSGSASSPGLLLLNQQYVTVSNLVFVGPGVNFIIPTYTGATINSGTGIYSPIPTTSTGGVMVETNTATGGKLEGVTLNNLDVSGYYSGIIPETLSATTPTGFDNLRILNCKVHEIVDLGIYCQACNGGQNWSSRISGNALLLTAQNIFTSTVIYGCEAYHVYGDNYTTNPDAGTTNSVTGPNKGYNSACCIITLNTTGGYTDHCCTHDNGWASSSDFGGSGGIWCGNCANYIIQYCEAYNQHNSEANGADGSNFDIDYNCTGCVIQYCYSHGADGAGMTMAMNTATPYNSFRYNVCADDGLTAEPYEINLYGQPTGGFYIYNNTFYAVQRGSTATPIIGGVTPTTTNCVIANNILYCASTGMEFLPTITGWVPLMVGNLYYRPDGFHITYNGTVYSSLAAFQGVAETITQAGVSLPVGLVGDPQFTGSNLSSPPSIMPAASSPQAGLATYNIGASSPAIDRAINLSSQYGYSTGSRAFNNGQFPQPGVLGNSPLYDIGAVEYPTGGYPATTTIILATTGVTHPSAGQALVAFVQDPGNVSGTYLLERYSTTVGGAVPTVGNSFTVVATETAAQAATAGYTILDPAEPAGSDVYYRISSHH